MSLFQVGRKVEPKIEQTINNARLPKARTIGKDVLDKVYEKLKHRLNLGKSAEIDIVDKTGVIRRGGGLFIPTYTSKAGDAGGGYVMLKGGNELFHLTGTGLNNSYIPAHIIDLKAKTVKIGMTGAPKVHVRHFLQAQAMLSLTDADGDGVYERKGFSGKYHEQRELDGTVSVFYSGGSHAGTRNLKGKNRLVFNAQTLMHGSWNLNRVEPHRLSKKVSELKKLQKENKQKLRSFSAMQADSRKGSVHDGSIAGTDSKAAGSGMYFADGAVTRHAVSAAKEHWHEHDQLQHAQLKELYIPASNQPWAVLERRTVAPPLYDSANGSYSFIRNYNSRKGVLHLIDSDKILNPMSRKAYQMAYDPKDGTLITDNWLEGSLADGTKIKTLVRSDGSFMRDAGASAGAKRYVLYVPGLKDGANGMLVNWEHRYMQPGPAGGLDYVETEASRLARSKARQQLQKAQSGSKSGITAWKKRNQEAAEDLTVRNLAENQPTGYYSSTKITIASNPSIRAQTSAVVYKREGTRAAFSFTRNYYDYTHDQWQEGIYMIREKGLNPKNDWIVKQAYDHLKADIGKSLSTGTWHKISTRLNGSEVKGEAQVRSDGSIFFRSNQFITWQSSSGWVPSFPKLGSAAFTMRPKLSEKGVIEWNKVPMVLKNGRYVPKLSP